MADAGWYPDPSDPTLQRYWDGGAWTEHTSPAAPPDPVAPEPVAPAPVAPAPPQLAPEPPAESAWTPPSPSSAPEMPVFHAAFEADTPPEQIAPAPPHMVGPSTWGDPRPSTAKAEREERPLESQIKRKRRKWPFVLVVIVVGAIYFMNSGKDEHPPVTSDDVVRLFSKNKVSCAISVPGLTTDQASKIVGSMPSTFKTPSGQLTPAEQQALTKAVDSLTKLVKALPDSTKYAVNRCGGSWIVNDAEATHAVVLGYDERRLEKKMKAIGLHVVVL